MINSKGAFAGAGCVGEIKGAAKAHNGSIVTALSARWNSNNPAYAKVFGIEAGDSGLQQLLAERVWSDFVKAKDVLD